MSKTIKEWIIIGGITAMTITAGFSVDMKTHFMDKIIKFFHTDITQINMSKNKK